MDYRIVEGDLLEQPVDAIVNPWNRNTIPWWLLLPQGVSGAIKKRGGTLPFKELARAGRMQLGQAVATGAGSLSFRRIIHVAGINDFWQASENSIRLSVRNALELANREGLASLALPLIGAGSGSFSSTRALEVVEEELKALDYPIEVTVVRYRK